MTGIFLIGCGTTSPGTSGDENLKKLLGHWRSSPPKPVHSSAGGSVGGTSFTVPKADLTDIDSMLTDALDFKVHLVFRDKVCDLDVDGMTATLPYTVRHLSGSRYAVTCNREVAYFDAQAMTLTNPTGLQDGGVTRPLVLRKTSR